MITRLTDTPEENGRPTVSAEALVTTTVDDVRAFSDVAPMGYAGGEFYPDDGLLVLTYRKHGNAYADPDDPDNDVEYADTGLGLLTVDRVVDLVARLTHGGPRPAITTRDQAEAWVLAQLGGGS